MTGKIDATFWMAPSSERAAQFAASSNGRSDGYENLLLYLILQPLERFG